MSKKQSNSNGPEKHSKKIHKMHQTSGSSLLCMIKTCSKHSWDQSSQEDKRDKRPSNRQRKNQRKKQQNNQRVRTRGNKRRSQNQQPVEVQQINNMPDCFQHFHNCNCQQKFSNENYQKNLRFAKNKILTTFLIGSGNTVFHDIFRKQNSQPTRISISELIKKLQRTSFNGNIFMEVKIKDQDKQYLEYFARSLNITDAQYKKKSDEQKLALELLEIILCGLMPQNFKKINSLTNFVEKNFDKFPVAYKKGGKEGIDLLNSVSSLKRQCLGQFISK